MRVRERESEEELTKKTECMGHSKGQNVSERIQKVKIQASWLLWE